MQDREHNPSELEESVILPDPIPVHVAGNPNADHEDGRDYSQ